MKTVSKGLAVLRVISGGEQDWGVTQVAQATGIDKVIVHRILKTLVAEQWAARDPDTRRYRLGPELVQIARSQESRSRAVDVARPHLVSLSLATGETAFVTLRHGYQVVVAASCESEAFVRVSSKVGHYAPLHCSATGKAFLAFEPPALVERTIARGLTPTTAQSITDPGRLREVVAETARRGWSEEREEFHDHISGVAAPIRGELGFVELCIAVRGPLIRLGAGSLIGLAKPTLDAADAISRELGYKA